MKLSIAEINSPKYTSSNIFVLNITKGSTKGPVVFNCPKINGRGIDTITVPDTFLPTNLIEFVTKDQVLDSTDFKSAIRNNFLTIIDEDEAAEIESLPGAKEERNRIQNNAAEVENLARSMLGENEAQIIPPQTTQPNDEHRIESKVSNKIESILANHEENGNVATLNSLRTMESDLTLNDLRHIKVFAKKHRIKNVFDFAKGVIKKRKEQKAVGIKI